MIFHTNPCNFEIFKSVTKYLLKHYRAKISFPFMKAIWILKCVKERFNGSLKNSRILICSFSLSWQNFSKENCFRVYRKLVTWLSHAKRLSEVRRSATVWNWSVKTLSPGVLLPVFSFLSAIFSRLFETFPCPHYLPLGLRGWACPRLLY